MIQREMMRMAAKGDDEAIYEGRRGSVDLGVCVDGGCSGRGVVREGADTKKEY